MRKSALHPLLLEWYARHRRNLPWRRTHNPYRILISEVMLQQTQVSRVLVFYKNWLRLFPTFSALAAAPKRSVLQAWSGLGYNNRALRIQSLAHIVVESFRSKLPDDIEKLQQLPGIGRYTAHALACFAFGQAVPVVDVNVKRILTRLFSKVTSVDAMLDEKEAWTYAATILPPQDAYDWNQALMDLGTEICTAVSPDCEICPLASCCRSAGLPALRRRSVRAKKQEPGFRGVPRRIIRGQILKLLHGKTQTSNRLRTSLSVRLSEKELRGILDTMKNDGLVRLRKSRTSIRISIAE
jgi:A/G-specific adenine glycosylase